MLVVPVTNSVSDSNQHLDLIIKLLPTLIGQVPAGKVRAFTGILLILLQLRKLKLIFSLLLLLMLLVFTKSHITGILDPFIPFVYCAGDLPRSINQRLLHPGHKPRNLCVESG